MFLWYWLQNNSSLILEIIYKMPKALDLINKIIETKIIYKVKLDSLC